jgi:hypothetical protein
MSGQKNASFIGTVNSISPISTALTVMGDSFNLAKLGLFLCKLEVQYLLSVIVTVKTDNNNNRPRTFSSVSALNKHSFLCSLNLKALLIQ